MTPLLAKLFINPVEMSSHWLWVAIPVSLAVASVYKTLRTPTLRQLPGRIALLTLYIVAGMAALMAGFWAVLTFTS